MIGMTDMKQKAARRLRRIASLEKRVKSLKVERRFLHDSYERLRKETTPPAERPKGMRLKVIPKRRLNVGRWYLGIGRGSNVAFWDGRMFHYFEEVMGEKSCNHWDDGPPFGCFQPFEEIDHREYGGICRYVEDAKSKARDRDWRRRWQLKVKPVGRESTEAKPPKQGR